MRPLDGCHVDPYRQRMHTCFQQVCRAWGFKSPSRTPIKDTSVRRGDHLGDHCFWARSVGHPQADPAVQLGLVAWVGVAEQREQVVECLGDGVELVGAQPLRWRFRQSEPGSGRLLDCGGFRDPAGDERRVASGIGGVFVSADLGVSVGDRLAERVDLAGRVVGGERCAVLSVGDTAEVVGQRAAVSSSRRKRSTEAVIWSSRR